VCAARSSKTQRVANTQSTQTSATRACGRSKGSINAARERRKIEAEDVTMRGLVVSVEPDNDLHAHMREGASLAFSSHAMPSAGEAHGTPGSERLQRKATLILQALHSKSTASTDLARRQVDGQGDDVALTPSAIKPVTRAVMPQFPSVAIHTPAVCVIANPFPRIMLVTRKFLRHKSELRRSQRA